MKVVEVFPLNMHPSVLKTRFTLLATFCYWERLVLFERKTLEQLFLSACIEKNRI